MTRVLSPKILEADVYNEKCLPPIDSEVNEDPSRNPVVESSEYAFKRTNLVTLNEEGIQVAAHHVHAKLLAESYSPRTWRTHPLHMCPSEPYDREDPLNKSVLNWIFLVSSLNFSFWSEKEGKPDRYGVEWLAGWDSKETKTWTGYWSLVASINRALQDDIPITDPNFYSSPILCPDSLIKSIFRPASQCTETIPLLRERIMIMRANGSILCNHFGGSFQGFLDEFHRRNDNEGTSLDLVRMITETFPSFRDEVVYEGRKVCLWKRAQILVAEAWAAFYPAPPLVHHPLFPGTKGPEIHQLTMFADYRVPQILHHLKILSYPQPLIDLLRQGTPLAPGSREEVSLRAASIVGVERVREEMLKLVADDPESSKNITSVVIDFFLWDLAKRVEVGDEKIEGIETAEMLPAHRTRSIWY